MSKPDYVRKGKKGREFFLGYGEVAAIDRRFMLGAGLALLAAGGASAIALSRAQADTQGGHWAMGDVRTYDGLLITQPYPILVIKSAAGEYQTALLVCQTKCGVEARLNNLQKAAMVRIRGSLIENGENRLIAVTDSPDWIEALAADLLSPSEIAAMRSFATNRQSIGDVSLKGEILDSKCWGGAMKPGYGKVHKSCAALCLRMGIPPAFLVRQQGAPAMAPLLIGPEFQALRESLLDFAGDPVRITGQLLIYRGLVSLSIDPDHIIRL